MAKKRAMHVWVQKLKNGQGPVACQMCGVKKSDGDYLITIHLPLYAKAADKELRLGIECASNFLHISRNGLEAWAKPKPKRVEIG